MDFNSIKFLIFFATIIIAYYVVQKRYRYFILLVASYFFYSLWGFKVLTLLFITTVLTYTVSYFIHNIKQNNVTKKFLLGSILFILVGCLTYYKFADYFSGILQRLLDYDTAWSTASIIMPIGLSFYIFKSISYLVDVYRNSDVYERNFFKFALYISFFPQIISGPIERSGHFFNELNKECGFNYSLVKKGFIRILWGFFKKMIIADNLAIMVAFAFDNYTSLNGFTLFFASLCYTFQIYCDFGAYSDIAIGISNVFGLNLMENFKQPYLSSSIAEFWRRWHISLSFWFRDYVYIPLGGSRKGMTRKNINLMVVFIISGLWHGSGLSFLMWGMLHGFYQVFGSITKPIRENFYDYLHIDKHTFSYRFGKILVTFLLVNFAWIFFRAPRLKVGIDFIKHMINNFGLWSFFDGSIFNLGVTHSTILLVLICLVIVFIVDVYKYKGNSISASLERQNIVFRWCVYFALIYAILIFGIYNTTNLGNFIYGGF